RLVGLLLGLLAALAKLLDQLRDAVQLFGVLPAGLALFLERLLHVLVLLIRDMLGLVLVRLGVGLLRLRLGLQLGLTATGVLILQLLGQLLPLGGFGIGLDSLGRHTSVCHAALCCCLGSGFGSICIMARCSAVCCWMAAFSRAV